MSGPLSVTCVQVGDLPGSPERRRTDVARLIEAAGRADLVVLPELWPVGYFAFDRYQEVAKPLHRPTVASVATAARQARAYLVLGSFVERSTDGLHNTTAIVGPDGKLIASYRKMHVFGYGSREIELTSGGEEPVVASTDLRQIGLAICCDLRFPELFRAMVEDATELFVVSAAWPEARMDHWRLLLRARAVENQAYVVGGNGWGSADGTQLAGHSVIVDPWGETVAEAGLESATLEGGIDLDHLHICRAAFLSAVHRRPTLVPRVGR